jgi:hypothetical protein
LGLHFESRLRVFFLRFPRKNAEKSGTK